MSGAPPPLRVGIVGYGPMGKAHSYGYRVGAAVQAVCDAMETSAASGRWVSIGEVLANTV